MVNMHIIIWCSYCPRYIWRYGMSQLLHLIINLNICLFTESQLATISNQSYKMVLQIKAKEYNILLTYIWSSMSKVFCSGWVFIIIIIKIIIIIIINLFHSFGYIKLNYRFTLFCLGFFTIIVWASVCTPEILRTN